MFYLLKSTKNLSKSPNIKETYSKCFFVNEFFLSTTNSLAKKTMLKAIIASIKTTEIFTRLKILYFLVIINGYILEDLIEHVLNVVKKNNITKL